MNLKLILLLAVIPFFACQNKTETATPIIAKQDTIALETETTPVAPDSIDIDDAVRWLTEVIESNLNENGYAMEDICTPTYNEYKSDATGVGYDGGMDEEAFNKKWASKYDVNHAGIGTAFLISGQDNGKVKVTKCKPKSGGSNKVFEVVISDPEMNATYHRDIKIIPVGKAYQIDDVVEYD